MKNLMIMVILLAVMILISCKTTKKVEEEVQDTSIKEAEVSPDDIVFMLKKGACYGSCPVYTLRIYNNMYTEFTGKTNTTKKGVHAKYISKEAYKELSTKFADANFLMLDDIYESNIPDLPSIKISYHTKDKRKTVSGKRERPESVHKIQFALEKIAESADGWTLIKSIDEMKQEPSYDKAKVIVELATGSQLATWFTKMRQEYGVQILESLTDNNDTWLISYNTREYKAEAFLKMLNDDPSIKSAEFQIKK